jgi:hypothetical protein
MLRNVIKEVTYYYDIVTKLKRMRWVGDVAHVDELRNKLTPN